jgi:C1A family cysteine protease
MKNFVVLCVFIAVASASFEQWTNFKTKYNKTYADPDVEHYRYTVFQTNLKRAEELQARELPGGATFGVTKFFDLTEEEFRTNYLLPKNFDVTYVAPEEAKEEDLKIAQSFAPNPTNWDWFSHGVCTPVYNQGQCGSCWAFSATETIESYWAIAGHGLHQLSMEQIVDCDTTCYGCGGGWPYLAYNYVHSQGGIDSYSSYPYTAEGGNSGSCQYKSGSVVAKVSGYSSVTGETGLYKTASTWTCFCLR